MVARTPNLGSAALDDGMRRIPEIQARGHVQVREVAEEPQDPKSGGLRYGFARELVIEAALNDEMPRIPRMRALVGFGSVRRDKSRGPQIRGSALRACDWFRLPRLLGTGDW